MRPLLILAAAGSGLVAGLYLAMAVTGEQDEKPEPHWFDNRPPVRPYPRTFEPRDRLER